MLKKNCYVIVDADIVEIFCTLQGCHKVRKVRKSGIVRKFDGDMLLILLRACLHNNNRKNYHHQKLHFANVIF